MICTRGATVAPATANDETRTVEVIWTTGARVLRGHYDRFYEELSLDPKHVRMDRLASGQAPLLANHDGARSRLHDRRGRVARVSRRARGSPASVSRRATPKPRRSGKVRQGVLTECSVGLPRLQVREGRGRRREDPRHASDGLGAAWKSRGPDGRGFRRTFAALHKRGSTWRTKIRTAAPRRSARQKSARPAPSVSA